jgi:hypothetical protein
MREETVFKKIGIIAGLVVALVLIGFGVYKFWALNNEIKKLTEERNDLSSQILNHQIEASIHGSVEESTSGIKTSDEASERLNNIVNRKMEGK